MASSRRPFWVIEGKRTGVTDFYVMSFTCACQDELSPVWRTVVLISTLKTNSCSCCGNRWILFIGSAASLNITGNDSLLSWRLAHSSSCFPVKTLNDLPYFTSLTCTLFLLAWTNSWTTFIHFCWDFRWPVAYLDPAASVSVLRCVPIVR